MGFFVLSMIQFLMFIYLYNKVDLQMKYICIDKVNKMLCLYLQPPGSGSGPIMPNSMEPRPGQ